MSQTTDPDKIQDDTIELSTPLLFEVGGIKVTRDHVIGALLGVVITKLIST